jgi:hypothetical protein
MAFPTVLASRTAVCDLTVVSARGRKFYLWGGDNESPEDS